MSTRYMKRSAKLLCCWSFALLQHPIALAQTPGSLNTGFIPNDVGYGAGDGADLEVSALMGLPDGRILVGGAFNSYNKRTRPNLVRLLSDGTVDPTFDIVQDPGIIPGVQNRVNSLVQRSDGSLLVGGIFGSFGGQPTRHLASILPDGAPDPTFNTHIAFFDPFDEVNELQAKVNSVIELADGRILVGGTFNDAGDLFGVQHLIRLWPDGSGDASFTFTPSPFTLPDDQVRSLALQPDGRIVVGGKVNNIAVQRILADGSPDPTFTVGNAAGAVVNTVLLQPDGRVVVGGSFTTYNGQAYSRIARLYTNGEVDPTFLTDLNGSVHTVKLLPDGRMLVGGEFSLCNGTPVGRLVRLNADGSLDAGYPVPYVHYSGGFDRPVLALDQESGGAVLAGGRFLRIQGRAFGRVARILPNGTVDQAFNQPATAANNHVWALAGQPDGKILVAGQFTGFAGSDRAQVVRLFPDGSIDPSFDPGLGADMAGIYDVALAPDGRIVVVGTFTTFGGLSRSRVARLNSDGTLDLTFDPGTGANGNIHAVAVQSDGKVIIGGVFTNVDGVARNRVARLNTDGTVDLGFDPGTGCDNTVYAALVEPSGTILIGGNFNNFNGQAHRQIVRLSSDGSALPFASVLGLAGAGSFFGVLCMALLPDGRVMVAGGDYVSGRLRRLNADGSMDFTFPAPSGPGGSYISDMVVQPDGRIVIVGTLGMFDGVPVPHIARVMPNGGLDPTFDPGTGSEAHIRSVLLRGDGGIIIGGEMLSYDGVGRNRIAALHGGPSVGIQGMIRDDEVRLSPNPTDGLLTVGIDEPGCVDCLIRVSGMDGRVVLEQRMSEPSTVLDVQHVAAGTYTLEIIDIREQRMVQRFIKQ